MASGARQLRQPTRLRRASVLLVPWLLAGCFSLTEALTERQVHSCVYTLGFLGPFVLVRTIHATGGASLTDCELLALPPLP
jgi:hypothetical protein